MVQTEEKKICQRVKAVLFDFDGTLTRQGALDFAAIKRSMDCPPDLPILEYIETISDPAEKQRIIEILDRVEMEAACQSVPNDGAEDLLLWLREKGILIGIITRNALSPVSKAFDNFNHISLAEFDVVISREDTARPKPSPEGVYQSLAQLGVEKFETLLVGDYLFDIEAGNSAGVTTVLLQEVDSARDVSDWGQDDIIYHLSELREMIEFRLPIHGGKLPNRFLNHFLSTLNLQDPSVLIPPGIGEDTAAVNIENEEVLILKSDPITFVSDDVAHYAVTINANDIVTSGATPRWFLSTLLFPPGVTPAEIVKVMEELRDFCLLLKVTLCGGHTEITDAVTRPVITGMIAGTVKKSQLIDKKKMKAGDCILITKTIAVEGTSILAREFEPQLAKSGLTIDEINAGKAFLEQITIIEEATIASGNEGVSAMHDVTEGGLATALEELSQAGNHKMFVDMDLIPVSELTRKMCSIFDLDPLGLIGSGSLIICCRADCCKRLIDDLVTANIQVSCIGTVLETGKGIKADISGETVAWPVFDADELTHLYR
ncbi:MAG: HAD-IA family hydrolase [Deltaproteobacteria bacterium]|nr:HAD-IA family hydrolase [Deltaproteobacteria bacterium]